MRAYSIGLKIVGIALIVSGALHFFLGLHADAMLGVDVPQAAMDDASMQSQNRFYGTTFTVMGFLLYLCGTKVHHYAAVIRIVFAVLFAAGIGRVISWIQYGTPSPAIIGIVALDLLLPPLFLLWYQRLPKTT